MFNDTRDYRCLPSFLATRDNRSQTKRTKASSSDSIDIAMRGISGAFGQKSLKLPAKIRKYL
jgi:hypothetical protein